MRAHTRELRTETLTIKLTPTEYQRLESLATAEASMREVARDLLLTSLDGPDPIGVAILSEVLALRAVVFTSLGHGVNALTPELMKTIVQKADQHKQELALKRLAKEG